MSGRSGPRCVFASDLHGRIDRWEKLFGTIAGDRPAAVFLGGDLLPHAMARALRDGRGDADFLEHVIRAGFARLRDRLREDYPDVFVILGNDDPRSEEPRLRLGEAEGLWVYAHARRVAWSGRSIYGYAFVPPTPFGLKDWERYDVSRYVDPGCVSPEEGWRTVPVDDPAELRRTIAQDLADLAKGDDLAGAIFLFHSPPYRSKLDRAALDGRTVDYAPVDVHVGSIAIRRFLEARNPPISLHGHVHESASLTGSWKDRIGETAAFTAAHDGPELAIVRFDPDAPENATREVV